MSTDLLEVADIEILTHPDDEEADIVIAALWRDAALIYEGAS